MAVHRHDAPDPAAAAEPPRLLRDRARAALTARHFQRLRHHLHSPFNRTRSTDHGDQLDTDLIAAGYVVTDLHRFGGGVAVTDEGRWALAASSLDLRDARQGHEDLIAALVAGKLAEHVVWTGIELPIDPVDLGGAIKRQARPDVFAVSGALDRKRWAPTTFEVKRSRADFLADLRAAKWRAYLAFSSRILFATRRGVADKDDVPAPCGLLLLDDDGRWREIKRARANRAWRLDDRQLMKLAVTAPTRPAGG